MSESQLERVRGELRRLGYLDPGFERFFLQDALRHRPPVAALARLAGREALVGGPLVAAVAAASLALANGGLGGGAGWADVPALWLHLLIPSAVAVALVFALVGAVVAVILWRAPRRLETASTGLALAAVAAAAFAAAFAVRGWIAQASARQALLLAAVTVAAAWILTRLVANGLLAWSIQVTERAPRRRVFDRGAAFAAAALLAGFVLGPLFLGRASVSAPDPVLPRAAGESVLLVGVDGVLPEEIEYLLRRGALPALADLRARGAALATYERGDETPAAFWTAVATGIESPRHGVAAFDAFRPRGVAQPLSRLGAIRAWFSRVEAPLGLAEQRAVLANRRSARTVWEIEARGGSAVVAVNWWATFPADPLAGLVVAHGADQLLPAGAAGVVQPLEAATPLLALRAALSPEAEPFAAALEAALGAAAGERAFEQSFRPDQFYRRATAWGVGRAPSARAVAVYLPGLDIAAAGWSGGEAAMADLVRLQLEATDSFIRTALVEPRSAPGTVLVVFDPGRRGASSGRVLIWRAAKTCEAGPSTPIRVETVAAALLRALGWPQSAELPEPPDVCPWPDPPARVATYGARRAAASSPPGEEYLENLKALGYL